MNPEAVLKRKPSKRLINTDCSFSLTFKKRRFATDEYNHALIISYNHNHPTLPWINTGCFPPSSPTARYAEHFEK